MLKKFINYTLIFLAIILLAACKKPEVNSVTITGVNENAVIFHNRTLNLEAIVVGSEENLKVKWTTDSPIATVVDGKVTFKDVAEKTLVKIYAHSKDDESVYDSVQFYVIHGEDGSDYRSTQYSNPAKLTTGAGAIYAPGAADPTVYRYNGYVYIFSTGGHIFKSEDGVNFHLIVDNCIGSPTWWQEVYDENPWAGLWAPDIAKIGDKWICYYSLSGWGKCVGIGYAVADNIEGPYKDMGKLFTWKEVDVKNSIDSHVFVEDDGRVYMSFGSFQGLYLIELTEDGMGLKGGVSKQKEDKVLIAGEPGNQDWDGSTYEGSYIIKKDGYYYYFGSVGTCCEGKSSTYHVRVGRSTSITGPYVDSLGRPMSRAGNGIQIGEVVVMGTIGNPNFAGPGHNSILVDDAGDYWIYYHSYSAHDNFATRHLFIDKLSWDENGYPYVEYEGLDVDGNIKTGKKKPSYNITLDGPRFV